MSIVTPLAGHHDESSAYLVPDYPYGFRLRTQIRYWTEAAPRKGVRFVSQTMDPKTGRWNKPKKSTFSRFAEAMYLDEEGHVQTSGLSEYSAASDVADYLRAFGLEGVMPDLPNFVVGKAKLYDALASGRAYPTINGVRQVATEEDVARYLREAEQWAAVRDAMAAMGAVPQAG